MENSAVAAVAAVAIKEQVMVLSGVSIDLIAKDLQQWTITYKEDPSQVVAYIKLFQG